MGRTFRALPSSEQIAELTPQMLTEMLRRNEVADLLADGDADPSTRAALTRLYDASESGVRRYADQIKELGGTPPDDPGPRKVPER